MHHLEFTYLIVCNLYKNTEGFLYIGLLLRGEKAVVLQDAELNVSTWCLRLYLLQQLLSCSQSELLRLLLLCGVAEKSQSGINASIRTKCLKQRNIFCGA